MRFAPAAAALSLCLAMTASISSAGDVATADPRAAALIAQGQAALAAGETQSAIDAFEAALAVDPSYTPIFIDLAEAARQQGLVGTVEPGFHQLILLAVMHSDGIQPHTQIGRHIEQMQALPAANIGQLQGAIEYL